MQTASTFLDAGWDFVDEVGSYQIKISNNGNLNVKNLKKSTSTDFICQFGHTAFTILGSYPNRFYPMFFREIPMLPENIRKTNFSIAIATVLQVVGLFLSQTSSIASILGLILILISIPVFIWGCSKYTEGKGYSKWVGMVGIAGLIGLIVLIMLPEQNREGLVNRLQMHKLIGLISILLGLSLAVLGRWFGDLAYRSAFTGGDVFLEESSADICLVVGICITLFGLILLMSNISKNKIG